MTSFLLIIVRIIYSPSRITPSLYIARIVQGVSLLAVVLFRFIGLTKEFKAIFPPFPQAGFTPNFTGYDLDKLSNWHDIYQKIAPDYSMIYVRICCFIYRLIYALLAILRAVDRFALSFDRAAPSVDGGANRIMLY